MLRGGVGVCWRRLHLLYLCIISWALYRDAFKDKGDKGDKEDRGDKEDKGDKGDKEDKEE